MILQHCFACVVIALFASSPMVFGDVRNAATSMEDVVHASKLGLERQKQLSDIISTELNDSAQIGADKASTAETHFRTLMGDLVNGKEDCDQQCWDVIVETVQWKMKNYAKLPSITMERRQTGVEYLHSIGTAVVKVLDEELSEVPKQVRAAIAPGVEARCRKMEPYVGNYFYPELLYIKMDVDLVELVRQSIRDGRTLEPVRSEYNSMRAAMSSPGIPADVKTKQWEMFADRQVMAFESVGHQVLKKACRLAEAREVYVPMSTKLLAAHIALGKRLTEEAQKKTSDEVKRISGQAMVNRMLEGTGMYMRDGVVVDSPTLEGLPTDPVVQEALPRSRHAAVQETTASGYPLGVCVGRRNCCRLSRLASQTHGKEYLCGQGGQPPMKPNVTVVVVCGTVLVGLPWIYSVFHVWMITRAIMATGLPGLTVEGANDVALLRWCVIAIGGLMIGVGLLTEVYAVFSPTFQKQGNGDCAKINQTGHDSFRQS